MRAPVLTALIESDLEVLRARHLALLQTTSSVALLETENERTSM